jgi:hypothetical protein
MLPRLEELLTAGPVRTNEDLDEAFFQACCGGQLRAAQRLMAAGADINASPEYAHGQTALDMAGHSDTRREQLATWLRESGAEPGGRANRAIWRLVGLFAARMHERPTHAPPTEAMGSAQRPLDQITTGG